MFENWPVWVEWIAVILNFTYVILAARQNISCWAFGALASAISVCLFIHVKLYSEAILYSIYVVLAYHGWREWRTIGFELDQDRVLDTPSESGKVIEWGLKEHAALWVLGISLALSISFVFNLTDAAKPLLDALTTSFSLIATWLTIKRVLSNWIYWIFIDGVSVFLYLNRGLEVYAFQMIVFAILAAWGFYTWRKEFISQKVSG